MWGARIIGPIGLIGPICALLAGCATMGPPPFDSADSAAGLVNWQGGETRLTADIVLARANDGMVRVVVVKGSNLLTITQIVGGWNAVGPLARGGWEGHPDQAPTPVAAWLALAEAYAVAPLIAGSSEFRNGRLSARFERSGGRLTGMEVVSVATGDRFRVRISE